jgi:hypothetical protein
MKNKTTNREKEKSVRGEEKHGIIIAWIIIFIGCCAIWYSMGVSFNYIIEQLF